MQEIELRFLIPPARLKGLMRQTKIKSSQVTKLAAHYYDTPEQALAKAGIGLRIRKEGDDWVQTIKAGGDGIAARLEHNNLLDNEQVQQMLNDNTLLPNLTLYKDTVIAPALADFKLKKLSKQLTLLYVTDVERITRLIDDDTTPLDDNHVNSQIEVAYDKGKIIHGNDKSQQHPIHEIEFELIAGDLDFLFDTAKTWCKRYKLCLSTVTKAERGGLLITGQAYSPAVSANLEQLNIDKKTTMPVFIRTAVHNCLLHILPNSSAIVAGCEQDSHVWQLYVGITRLYAVLQAFAGFSDHTNPEWLPILKQTATLLDDYRQRAYLASSIEPNLQRHNAPIVDWTAELNTIKIKPIDAISANDFQLTLLELIAFTMSDPSLETQADSCAKDKLPEVLSQQQDTLIQAAQNLPDTYSAPLESSSPNNNDTKDANAKGADAKNTDVKRDDQQALYNLQHELALLRYMGEFAIPVFDKKKSKKKSKRWLKRITKAQKAINHYRSHEQYQQYYQNKSATDAKALYGAGWFAAKLASDYKRSQKRLAKAVDSTAFW